MRVIIAGSRNITDLKVVAQAWEASKFNITEVVTGCARGVDTLAILVAKAHEVPVKRFPADWLKHGRAAGIMRNIEMAKYAEALIAVWDGKSFGTKHMLKVAADMNLPLFIHRVES